MAESNHDDLADALARLAGGDVAPSEHEPEAPPAPPTPVAPAAPRAVRPASTRPTAPRPAAPAPAPRPVAPAPPRPPRPAAPIIASPVPSVPDAPAPVIRAVAPVARRARPAAPTIAAPKPVEPPSAEAEVDGGQSTGLTGEADPSVVIDDDDNMNIPAPEASVFEHRPKDTTDFKAKAAARKKMDLRRTLIPILLTCGVMMLAFASLKFVTGGDSSLSNVPIWVPILLVCAGGILLALAVVNMLSVKAQMDAAGK